MVDVEVAEAKQCWQLLQNVDGRVGQQRVERVEEELGQRLWRSVDQVRSMVAGLNLCSTGVDESEMRPVPQLQWNNCRTR